MTQLVAHEELHHEAPYGKSNLKYDLKHGAATGTQAGSATLDIISP